MEKTSRQRKESGFEAWGQIITSTWPYLKEGECITQEGVDVGAGLEESGNQDKNI